MYLILILIIIVFIIIKNYSKVKKYKNALSKKTIKLFSGRNFSIGGIYADIPVTVLEYNNNHNIIINKYTTTMGKFVKSCCKKQNKNKCKQVLITNPKNLQLQKAFNSLRSDMNKLLNYPGKIDMKLRISCIPWKYGAHFDCDNIYLVQLYNKRSIGTVQSNIWKYKDYKLSLKELTKKYKNMKKNILQPGDLLYIPMATTHAISSLISNCPESNISIACSISVHTIPSKKSNNCDKAFTKDFPERIDEIERGDE